METEGMDVMDLRRIVGDSVGLLSDVKSTLTFIQKASEIGFENPKGFVEMVHTMMPNQVSELGRSIETLKEIDFDLPHSKTNGQGSMRWPL